MSGFLSSRFNMLKTYTILNNALVDAFKCVMNFIIG